MLRKPVFWIAFVLAAALATLICIRGFAEAFPVVTLDLKMTRAQALEQARAIAQRYGFGPAGFRQAAEFALDNQLQAFVELEAGGNEAFAKLLKEGPYSPYAWHVRHFKEYETLETLVRFKPDGTPYGFLEKIPEKEPGAKLEPDAARTIAERAATQDWGIDLSRFERVETSREVRPSERVDHTFVYERPTERLGEGRFRLRLVVSGDRLTELTHFVKIPEAFQRRYEEMRSANNAIAMGALGAGLMLFFVGGGVVGLFFLIRVRWVVWKPALGWAVFIASLGFLETLNGWPLAWMGYDTAVSTTSFALQQVAYGLVQALAMGGVMTLSFMAAESLTRRAFPRHVQLWRIWSPEVASTKPVLGFTVAGFLLVTAFSLYEVGLYVVARKYLGWWNPSEALTDPNVLATYFPWLRAIAISLQAGFWEESLFRAVPIAGAALLGQRYGGRRWWIAAAFIVQALVFAGGHANYPAQPAYARLVELILPAIGFGLVYLFFGLLPAIIMHFAIDVFWIGLPVFAASGPGTGLDKIVIVALTLVPLWIVLVRRLRSGAWRELPEAAYNAAWTPPPPAPPREAPIATVAAEGLGARARTLLFAGGAVGLVVWLLATSFRADTPPLPVSRATATAAARGALAERAFTPAPPWRELSSVEGSAGPPDRFVWQEGGREAYRGVLGTYLEPPEWLVRYARFEGDVAERADEYRVWIGADAKPVRVDHTLPEGREGKALEQDQARSIAHGVLRARFGLDPAALREVSAEPSQLPKRRDWKLVFADPKVDVGPKGEARIEVRLAGDEVVGASRFVKVPEEWQRKEQDREARMRLVAIATSILIAVLVVGAVVTAIVFWTKGRFSVRAFLVVLVGLAILGIAETLNAVWPAAVAGFSTAQPYPLQLAVLLGAALVGTLLFAAILGLIIGLVRRWLPPENAPSMASAAVVGLALGALLAGIQALGFRFAPHTLPTWPDLGAASAYLPWLSAALSPLRDWLARTAIVLFVVSLMSAMTSGWTRRRAVASLVVALIGLVMTGRGQADTVTMWLLAGLLAGVVFSLTCVFVLRLHPWSTPFAAATMTALGTIREGAFRAHPGALGGAVLGVVLLGVVCFLFDKLRRA